MNSNTHAHAYTDSINVEHLKRCDFTSGAFVAHHAKILNYIGIIEKHKHNPRKNTQK